jgi:hypothetical protein
MSRESQLPNVVTQLRQAIPELTGVMIASEDGLAIAHDFSDAQAARVAAMAATALGLGRRILTTTELGDLGEAVIRGTGGHLVIYSAGNVGVLVVQAPSSANLGLIHLEARSAAKKVAAITG